MVAPNRFGSEGLALDVVVEVVEELLPDAAAAGGGGGGVVGVDLSALAPVHDLQAAHCGEDVVLHLLQKILRIKKKIRSF